MVKPKKQSICVKRRKKKGYFGKIDGASQPTTESIRDTSNVLLSSFKGKRKLSAFY
jgi:hypothetical protein